MIDPERSAISGTNLANGKPFNKSELYSITISEKGGLFMNDLFKGLLAGAAAWKLGGGLISTILIFIVVFWLLGKC